MAAAALIGRAVGAASETLLHCPSISFSCEPSSRERSVKEKHQYAGQASTEKLHIDENASHCTSNCNVRAIAFHDGTVGEHGAATRVDCQSRSHLGSD